MSGRATILIVNYNGGDLLESCVASLSHDPVASEAEVIVVDNGSIDGSAERLNRAGRVKLVSLPQNPGFGAANNAGMSLVATPYVLMLNPDTELAEGSLGAMLDAMDGAPRLGLLGCKLVDRGGVLLKTVRRMPSLTRELSESLFVSRVLGRRWPRLAEALQDDRAYDSPQPAEWVSGAVMLVRTQALMEIGGFDEGFFLFTEEIDLCRRLRDAQWEVGYDPSLTISHLGGAYTVDSALAIENQRSKLRYFRKHHGRLQTAALASVLVPRLALRAALWGASGAARKDRALLTRSATALRAIAAYGGLTAEALLMPRPVTIAPHLIPATAAADTPRARYVVVTPARNESATLRGLAASLYEQTLPFERWVIVDDGSTDDTLQVAEKIAARDGRVTVVQRLAGAPSRKGAGGIFAFNEGLRTLGDLSEYDFIGNLDADLLLPPQYYACIAAAFRADGGLGIAGGHCYHRRGKRLLLDRVPDWHVRGATKTYRVSCYRDVAPLPEVPAWDTVDEVRAWSRGWRTHSLARPGAEHRRPVTGGEGGGTLRGKFTLGRNAHFLGYLPVYMALRLLRETFRPPLIVGALSMGLGYVYGAAAGDGVFDDLAFRRELHRHQRVRMQQVWRRAPRLAGEAGARSPKGPMS